MTVISLNDGTHIVTDLSEDDLRRLIYERLSEEVGKWFDTIILNNTFPREGENYEIIADGYYTALQDCYRILTDDSLTNKKKLNEIEKILKEII